MTYEQFMDDMDSIEINEAIDVSGIASKSAIVKGHEMPLVEWIWEDKIKRGVKIIKG
jgi:hypothetical protein